MRSFDAATTAYLQGSPGIIARVLVWVRAKNRVTALPEVIGLWTGDDHEAFTIDGEVRTYFGAGNLQIPPEILYQTGLFARNLRLSLASLTPEAQQLLRGYEPRFAPVEMHRVLLSTDSHARIASPHRIFKGWIDQVQINTGATGGVGSAEVTLVSTARGLGRTIAQRQSDNTQRLRAGDRFRRYADVSGAVETVWGSKRSQISAPQPAPAPRTPRGGNDNT